MRIHRSSLSLLLLLLVAATIAGGAQAAGQSAKSADRVWTLTTDTDVLAVKKESELTISASSAGTAMAKCPDVESRLSRRACRSGARGGGNRPS